MTVNCPWALSASYGGSLNPTYYINYIRSDTKHTWQWFVFIEIKTKKKKTTDRHCEMSAAFNFTFCCWDKYRASHTMHAVDFDKPKEVVFNCSNSNLYDSNRLSSFSVSFLLLGNFIPMYHINFCFSKEMVILYCHTIVSVCFFFIHRNLISL